MPRELKEECRCWSDYPNTTRPEKCKNYECFKERTLYQKTRCRLKNEYKEKIENTSILDIPQHFTKSQKEWIKEFVKIRCKETRNAVIDECIDTLYDVTPQTADQKLDMVFVNALEQLKRGNSNESR